MGSLFIKAKRKKLVIIFSIVFVLICAASIIFISNKSAVGKTFARGRYRDYTQSNYLKADNCSIQLRYKYLWKEGNEYSYLADINLVGNDSQVDGWNLDVTFPQDISLKQSWSGDYTYSDKVLKVKNLPCNGIFVKDKTVNLGFIFNTSTMINVNRITINMKSEKKDSIPTVKPTKTPSEKTPTYVNPNDYVDRTTINVLPISSVDLSSDTEEFRNSVKDCTTVAYAYADPIENADPTKNISPNGAKSIAAYIFGYDGITEVEYLNAKKAVPYVLNKLYFDSKLNETWYKQLVAKHPVYIRLVKPGESNYWAGIKYGNLNDGFGMALADGVMKTSGGNTVLYHEMSHCIWDCGININDFVFGIDPRTNIDYGTANFLNTFNKLYDDSIKTNKFYEGTYGWEISHENYAESACRFFDTAWREKLKQNDPIVYRILEQIYTKF